MLTMLSALGVARYAAGATATWPSASTSAAAAIANDAARWIQDFSGANLAVGEALDLRHFVTAPAGATLRFSLNPVSAPIAGVLTLTPAGVLTRIGQGTVAGVLIDVDGGG